MTGFQLAFARETLKLAERVLDGEHFKPAVRREIARMIWNTLRYRKEGELDTPQIRDLQYAYLDLKGIERAVAAGGER